MRINNFTGLRGRHYTLCFEALERAEKEAYSNAGGEERKVKKIYRWEKRRKEVAVCLHV